MPYFNNSGIRITINVTPGDEVVARRAPDWRDRPLAERVALRVVMLPMVAAWTVFKVLAWLTFGLIVGMFWALLARRA